MSVPTVGVPHLPEDIWGKIATHCDIKTLYAFRGSCRAANAIGRDYMSEEVAARVIFHNPERYSQLRLNALKESRKVAFNAVVKLPGFRFTRYLPEQFRQDASFNKTALLAADILYNDKVFNFDALPEEIRENIDIILKMVQRWPYPFFFLNDRMKDSEEVARAYLKQIPYGFRSISPRLQNDIPFVRSLIQSTGCWWSDIFKWSGDNVRSDFWCARKAVMKDVFNLLYVKGASRFVLWPLFAPIYILKTMSLGLTCVGLGFLQICTGGAFGRWMRRMLGH